MAKYDYEAVRDDGGKVSGSLEADSPKAARAAVRALGLLPMAIEESGPAPSGKGAGKGGSLSASERALWTRQLAGLVSSGLNLERALSELVEDDGSKVSRLSTALRSRVNEGASFARALSEHPESFPEVYVAVVAASEEAGSLGKALGALADQLAAREELRGKLVGASLYPAIVCLLAVAVVGFLLAYVVPQVAGVFAHSKRALPWLTQVMLGASALAKAWGPWALGAAALLGALGARALKRPAARLAFDAWTLRLPLAGPLIQSYNAANYGSTLAMLTGSGVPMVKALTGAAMTLGNSAMRQDALEVVALVREGASLGGCLSRKPRFPKLLATFARLGEQSGQLPDMLSKASGQIGEDVQRKAMRMATILEPLLIVAMGVAVMLIVVAVLLPIINMSSLAR